MKPKTRNKYGVFFGLNVADMYTQIFSCMGHDETLPGWKHEVPVVSGVVCAGRGELVDHVDELIRDLERLKKWALKRVDL